MEKLFKVVQPWGKDLARESTVVSEHASAADAFAAIDRMAEKMLKNGVSPDVIGLFVIDAGGRRVHRTTAH